MSARPEAERDAAWKFIKWLVEPEQQAEWFAGSGYLPVRNSAYDLPAAKDIIASYPQFQLPVDLFAKTATTTAALGPLLGPFQQVRDAVTDAIESMLSGAPARTKRWRLRSRRATPPSRTTTAAWAAELSGAQVRRRRDPLRHSPYLLRR